MPNAGLQENIIVAHASSAAIMRTSSAIPSHLPTLTRTISSYYLTKTLALELSISVHYCIWIMMRVIIYHEYSSLILFTSQSLQIAPGEKEDKTHNGLIKHKGNMKREVVENIGVSDYMPEHSAQVDVACM